MKTLTGKIVSDKMNKTVVVEVINYWQHPVYKKRVKRSKKYLADNDLSVKISDLVKIGEIRPISKNKRWRVLKIIKK